MIESLSVAIVILIGVYFIALGAIALLAPMLAKRFLLGFASSLLTHYVELLVRMVAGGALLVQSPRMPFADLFNLFGWVLVITTACLFLVQWQWHHRFARLAVPQAMRYLTLMGLCSLVLGGLVILAVAHGAAS